MAKTGPTSVDPKPLFVPPGTIIREEDTKDYYIFDAEEQMWVKIMEPLQGWLHMMDNDCERFKYCPYCGADMRENDNG